MMRNVLQLGGLGEIPTTLHLITILSQEIVDSFEYVYKNNFWMLNMCHLSSTWSQVAHFLANAAWIYRTESDWYVVGQQVSVRPSNVMSIFILQKCSWTVSFRSVSQLLEDHAYYNTQNDLCSPLVRLIRIVKASPRGVMVLITESM